MFSGGGDSVINDAFLVSWLNQQSKDSYSIKLTDWSEVIANRLLSERSLTVKVDPMSIWDFTEIDPFIR